MSGGRENGHGVVFGIVIGVLVGAVGLAGVGILLANHKTKHGGSTHAGSLGDIPVTIVEQGTCLDIAQSNAAQRDAGAAINSVYVADRDGDTAGVVQGLQRAADDFGKAAVALNADPRLYNEADQISADYGAAATAYGEGDVQGSTFFLDSASKDLPNLRAATSTSAIPVC